MHGLNRNVTLRASVVALREATRQAASRGVMRCSVSGVAQRGVTLRTTLCVPSSSPLNARAKMTRSMRMHLHFIIDVHLHIMRTSKITRNTTNAHLNIVGSSNISLTNVSNTHRSHGGCVAAPEAPVLSS